MTIWNDLLGSEVRFIDAGGVKTRLVEAGDGPPVILMHGVGGHAEAFARNVLPLAERHRVIAIDLLGFGLTEKPEGKQTHQGFVDHLVALLDVLSIDRAHLVGESLGGWVAMWTALTQPDRVDRLVSVCGARLSVETDEESKAYTAAGREDLIRLTEQYIADPTRDNVRRRLEWLFHDPSDVTDELVDLRWTLYQQPGALESLSKAVDRMKSGGTGDPTIALTAERLQQITHPTLMLWTSHNPSTTAATAKRAAAYMPNCEFVLMDGCAHWPQWEEPAMFNQYLSAFLGADVA